MGVYIYTFFPVLITSEKMKNMLFNFFGGTGVFTPLPLWFGSKGSKCLYDGPKPVQSLVARGYPNQISAQKQKKVNCTLKNSLKHGRGRHIASYLTSRGRHIAPTIVYNTEYICQMNYAYYTWRRSS